MIMMITESPHSTVDIGQGHQIGQRTEDDQDQVVDIKDQGQEIGTTRKEGQGREIGGQGREGQDQENEGQGQEIEYQGQEEDKIVAQQQAQGHLKVVS